MPRSAVILTLVAVLGALGVVRAADATPPPAPLSVEFSEDRQQYRVCVTAPAGQPVDLDLSSLRPLFDCPLGVRIVVTNARGELLFPQNPEFGYSPSDKISEIGLKGPANWTRIDAGSVWYSPWYRVGALLSEFEQCVADKDPTHWQRLQLYVYVLVNAREPTQLAFRTDWWSPTPRK